MVVAFRLTYLLSCLLDMLKYIVLLLLSDVMTFCVLCVSNSSFNKRYIPIPIIDINPKITIIGFTK